MKTNKQLALEINKNLKSKQIKVNRWAIFDGDKQVAPDCYSPQTAWSNAVIAVGCPFPVGSKVLDTITGDIFEIIASTFGYPHFYRGANGSTEGSVLRLFRYTDSDRFVAYVEAEHHG